MKEPPCRAGTGEHVAGEQGLAMQHADRLQSRAVPHLPSGAGTLMGGSHGGQPGHLGDPALDRDHGSPVNCSAGFSGARAPTWESELGPRQENQRFSMN